ncbi:hypothetical protein C7G41_30885 [Bradyrhizobium sp. MOS002]|nr:hypothetical protein C7G41_30885 [Bradyrhizobium sp. MOS002]
MPAGSAKRSSAITRHWRSEGGSLPPPLAGEGWGEGISATGQSPRGKNPHPVRGTMLRIARDAPTSPASGRGAPRPRHVGSTQNPHDSMSPACARPRRRCGRRAPGAAPRTV